MGRQESCLSQSQAKATCHAWEKKCGLAKFPKTGEQGWREGEEHERGSSSILFLSLCHLGRTVLHTQMCRKGRWQTRRGADNLRSCGQGCPCWFSGENLPVNAGDNGFYPWAGKIPHASGQLSFRTATTEALAPHSLCSVMREATGTRTGCAPHLVSSPCSAHCNQRKPVCRNKDLAKPKNNK